MLPVGCHYRAGIVKVNRLDHSSLFWLRGWATHDITPTYAAPTARIGRFAVDDRGSWASRGPPKPPTLVLGAEHDRITPASVERKIAARYGSEYMEAAGHAHMLMLEEGWEQPFGKVLSWLARVV